MPMISLAAADGFRLQAYRTGPQDAARALVVTQEIFGVNRHIRKLCDDFAAGRPRFAATASVQHPLVPPAVQHGTNDECYQHAHAQRHEDRQQHAVNIRAAAAAAAAAATCSRSGGGLPGRQHALQAASVAALAYTCCC